MSEKYGEGNEEVVKEALEKVEATWTPEGWIVKGDLYLGEMDLTRLPKIKSIGGNFNCSKNQLISLEGAPEEVGGYFGCSYNQLTSLEGSPREVGEHFYCTNNQLISLEGVSEKVGEGFWCSNNQLTSLEGAPEKIGGDFACWNNQLSSLEEDTKLDYKRVVKFLEKIGFRRTLEGWIIPSDRDMDLSCLDLDGIKLMGPLLPKIIEGKLK